MASEMKLIEFDWDKSQREVEQILRDLIEARPDSVIVFAFFRGDDEIIIRSSRVEDKLRVLGAMEMAKHHLLEN